MRRLIILAASVIAALGAAAIPASAATTAPSVAASGVPGGSQYVYWWPNVGLGWYKNVNNVYVISGSGSDLFNVLGGTWTEIQNVHDSNKCVTWNGGPNQIYDVSCRNAPSQLWASVKVGGIGSTVYMLWNQYVKDTNPRECGNTLAPVITADGSNGDLYLSCPQGGPTTYTADQQWDITP